MANLNTPSFSRYSNFYDMNSKDLFIYNIPSEILISDKDNFIIVKSTDRLYSLSAKYFGDPRYWWIILMINGKQVIGDIEIGEEIRIPTDINFVFDKIRNYIKSQK